MVPGRPNPLQAVSRLPGVRVASAWRTGNRTPAVGRGSRTSWRAPTDGTIVRIRLPRKTVRALRGRASRKSRAVAVRLVVSFKAKPRPIVRFVDFRIPVQRARRR